MMQTGCIPLKRIRKSNSSWKRKIDGVTYLLVPLSATSDIEIDGIRIK